MNSGSNKSEQRIRNNRIRRRRELQRKRRAAVLVLFMTVLFSSSFFSIRIRAEGNRPVDLTKYYTSIQVKSGDTLWDYACQYGNRQYYKNNREYVEEVMAINFLKDDTITAGQYLILPYYRLAGTGSFPDITDKASCPPASEEKATGDAGNAFYLSRS